MLASRVRSFALILVSLLASALPGCGGSNSSATSPTTPTNPNVVTITSTGVSPKTINISLGSRVTFVNNDSRTHNMFSDPHPEHTDCPEINQIGFLSPGQSRDTGNFVVARSCGYHDHDDPLTTSLQGTIIIK